MIQRFKNWRHERYIDRLARRCERAQTSGDRLKTKLYWDLMVVAIRSRSVTQVRRMESQMDFNVRRTIKRRVMGAFLRGRVPSTFVTAIFRLLRLRSL